MLQNMKNMQKIIFICFYKYRGHNRGDCKLMCLSISSFDNIRSGSTTETSGSVALENSGSMVASIFGGMSSNSSTGNVETSGQVACLFGDNLSLDSNGAEAGGEIVIGSFSGGGGCSSGGGGGISLA